MVNAVDERDVLGALGRVAVDANSHEELRTRAAGVLEPAVGPDRTRRLLGDLDGDSAVHHIDVFDDDVAALLLGVRRRLEAEGELCASNQRLASSDRFARVLLDSAAEGLYGLDLEGRCTFANQACVRLLGFGTEEELLGRNMHELIHHTRPDGTPYPPDECHAYRAYRAGHGTERDDEVLFRRDGSSFSAAYRSSPIEVDGRLVGAVVTFTDVTERLRAEAQLEQDRRLKRIAGSSARIGGWSIDVAANEVSWSEEIFEILGYRRDDGPDMAGSLGLYLPGHRERLEAALDACARTGMPFDLDVELINRHGQRLWARVIAEASVGGDGTVTHVIGSFQDITDLRETAERANELADRLTTTLESITDAFFTLDRDWRFTYVNGRAGHVLQRDRDELLGRRIFEEFAAVGGTPLEEAYRRAMEEAVTVELDEYHYAPLDTWFHITAYPSPQGVAVYFRDVTEEHFARRALEEREARLREQAQLLDQARDVIIVRDLEHRITYFNRSAEELYGYRAADVIGRCGRTLLHDDPEPFDRAMEALLEHGEWSGEFRHVAADASDRLVEARWTLVRDEAGVPQAVLSFKTDVTDRKRIEQQLLRAQRMESLGTLAGGIAHDLNNVLAPILLSAQTLQLGGHDERTQRIVAAIETSALRGADMVRQVLSFARGVEGERKEIDVAEVIAEVVCIVGDTFPKNVTIEHEPARGRCPVLGDRTQLHQVLMNLSINARDAMPNGGRLRLSADTVIVDEHYPARDQQAVPGEYVVLRVEDEGTGMDAATVEHLFEPFFTTKPQGAGTGLGLPTARGIVRSHGGFFHVYSEPGRGSTFLVHLPVATTDAPSVGTDALEGVPPRGNGEVVLIVDDEAIGRAAARLTLETHGYRVLEAGDGAEALEVLDTHGDEVAVVFTDIMMPTMDGPATIQAIRARRDDLPVVAMSGLTANVEQLATVDLDAEHFLRKPYTTSDLLQLLHRALGRRPVSSAR